MNTVKKCVAGLSEYSVLQDMGVIKLNQNESPRDIPREVKQKILSRMETLSWNRYPPAVPDSLKERLSDYTGFPSSGILIGNGSNELIQTLVYAFCDSGDRVLVIQPGFSIYERISEIMNVSVVKVPLKKNFSFDVESLICGSRDVRLMIVASPNNPTGTRLTGKQAEQLLKGVSCPVVIDEAYYEFSGQSFTKFIQKGFPLFVLRTFSKAFCLAGLRLGYVLGAGKNILQLGKAKLPFSVDIFSQIAGEVLMENRSFLESNLREIVQERERVYAELKKCPGISPYRSSANFILFRCEGMKGTQLFRRLYEQGILVRSFREACLSDMLRVTVGRAEENTLFLEKMADIMQGGKK
ncbi:MAG: histidinol-phosphate transaminase [Candidatus Aminicenantes bacterium]|nr:histidinol-phosphate transaminase [Candidatus Aminicenantes bacterium]